MVLALLRWLGTIQCHLSRRIGGNRSRLPPLTYVAGDGVTRTPAIFDGDHVMFVKLVP